MLDAFLVNESVVGVLIPGVGTHRLASLIESVLAAQVKTLTDTSWETDEDSRPASNDTALGRPCVAAPVTEAAAARALSVLWRTVAGPDCAALRQDLQQHPALGQTLVALMAVAGRSTMTFSCLDILALWGEDVPGSLVAAQPGAVAAVLRTLAEIKGDRGELPTVEAGFAVLCSLVVNTLLPAPPSESKRAMAEELCAAKELLADSWFRQEDAAETYQAMVCGNLNRLYDSCK